MEEDTQQCRAAGSLVLLIMSCSSLSISLFVKFRLCFNFVLPFIPESAV